MPLPNLLVLGAMKAGTTSLHWYLDAHPEISMAQEKEVNFFSHEARYRRGPEWYARRFQDAPVRGETSTNYSKYPRYPEVAERAHALVPNARLLYVVRDPIERAASHYHHCVCDHLESRGVDEAFADLRDNHYVRCSLYAMQMHRYLRLFSPDALRVVSLEELRSEPRETLRAVYSFLGVDPYHPTDTSTVHNPSAAKGRRTTLRLWASKMRGKTRLRQLAPAPVRRAVDRLTLRPVPQPVLSQDLRARLWEAFEDDVRELRLLTGRELGPWGET